MFPSKGGRGRHIAFGADPIIVVINAGVGVTLSCMQDISFTSGQIGAKFALIWDWGMMKPCPDFQGHIRVKWVKYQTEIVC